MARVRAVERFIPTPVGNTPAAPTPAPCAAVHPHARGEHAHASTRACGAIGSSPRPWGTPQADRDHGGLGRFIPTPVGNTAQPKRRCGRRTVHPHARGEHLSAMPSSSATCGSSPRPWGTPHHFCKLDGSFRFIPTPVGNTSGPARRVCPAAVHPHARGEHTKVSMSAMTAAGSSPRPWGTPGGLMSRVIGGRFIPTPVGNTATSSARPS